MPAHVHVRRAELLPVVPGETRRQRRRTGGNPAQRTLADVLQPRCDVGTHRQVPLPQQAELTVGPNALAGAGSPAYPHVRSFSSGRAAPRNAGRKAWAEAGRSDGVAEATATRAATSQPFPLYAQMTILSRQLDLGSPTRRLCALGISERRSRNVARRMLALTGEADLGQEIAGLGVLPRRVRPLQPRGLLAVTPRRSTAPAVR